MSECRIPVGFLNPDSIKSELKSMATSEPPQTGYDDALFVNPPSPSLGLHCPICYLILKEPHLLSCCGKHMCQSCLKCVTTVGRPQTCPCCRSEGFQAMLNKEKQATIKGLIVRCMNETKGCDWTGELGYSQEHLEKRCQYVEVPCQYECGEKCLRSSITSHEKDQCINRPVEVKLESFMRQVAEKMATQEKEMADLKEQVKKHESNEKKLELDAQKMKRQIASLKSIIASMPQEIHETVLLKGDFWRISIKKGAWSLFHSVMEGKWKALEGEMKEGGIRIICSSKPTALEPFVKIKGERKCVAQLQVQLTRLEDSVREKRVKIAKRSVVQYLYKDPNGQVLLKGIENEAKVCIELEIGSIKTDPATPTGIGSTFTKVCSANTRGVTVNLYTGDITLFNKAEVIVNAAHENLAHGLGLAAAIAERGGPVIKQDCNSYATSRGVVRVGHAVIFHRVGDLPLPYQAIVHAVGPMWSSGNKERNKVLLYKTVRNALENSKEYNSIAIPAIGTGMIFGFPIDIAASSAMKGVSEFLTSGSSSNLNEINFIVPNDKVYTAAFKKAIEYHIKNVYMFDEAIPLKQYITITKEEVFKIEAPADGDHDILSSISSDSKVAMCIYGVSNDAVQQAEKMLRSVVMDTYKSAEDIVFLRYHN